MDISPDKPEAGNGPHGLFVLDKPPGPSSYDCIRKIRRGCKFPRRWKIGHLGTLDPFASGVLVIALGKAVRYAEFALKSRKKYRARIYLGEMTDTLDPTGTVIKTADVPDGWEENIAGALKKFTGIIRQVPPEYSAKKIDGVRSYKSARAGEHIELKPIDVTIYDMLQGEIGENWFDITCEVSAGTYIRSLGRDIAESLGTVGFLAGLERIAAGNFNLDMAIPLLAVETGGTEVINHHVRGIENILTDLPGIAVCAESLEKIVNGKRLLDDDTINGEYESMPPGEIVRLVSGSGEFLSLGRFDSAGKVIPYKPWSTIS